MKTQRRGLFQWMEMKMVKTKKILCNVCGQIFPTVEEMVEHRPIHYKKSKENK